MAETSEQRAPVADAQRRLRQALHWRVLASIETEGSEGLRDRGQARERIRRIADAALREEWQALSPDARQALEEAILAELGGMGPLAPLMGDADITDILVNGPDAVWIDRKGQLQRTGIRFDDDAHLRRFIDRLVANQGRHLDESSPMVDVKLDDGSRVHAIVPPLSTLGPVVSIRRFRPMPFSAGELVVQGALDRGMADFLRLAVESRRNIVVSGGAASGKTTLLNVLSGFIPENERVVTIEETGELRLQHHHVIPLEARPPNIEGKGEVTLRSLLRNALRMRADRIIVGEVRGSEVFDMLQAMNIGHDGSLTTIHANSPADVLRRLESLVLMSGVDLPRRAIYEMLGAALHFVVHMGRFADGMRRVVSIRALRPSDEDLTAHELFGLHRDARGGFEHRADSEVPAYIERLRRSGGLAEISAGDNP